MTTLNDVLNAYNREKYATDIGVQTHKKLQHVVIDGNVCHGDKRLIDCIKARAELMRFFNSSAKTEVAVAGIINNKFISRRIDRLCIDDFHKHISVLDYKTDTNRDMYHEKYVVQLQEYVMLLNKIYPQYQIDAYILWTHDFSLEKIM